MSDLSLGMGGPQDMDEGPDPVIFRKCGIPSEDPAEGPHSISLKRFKGRRGDVNADFGQENRDSSLIVMKCFEDYLHECCRLGLVVDDHRLQQAVELFRKIKSQLLANLDATDSGRGVEPIWGACVLYVVKRLGAGPSAGGLQSSCFTLSQLLQVTKLSVVDFFKELAHFVAKVGTTVKSLFGDDCERRLQIRESQTNFVHLVVLFNYYKRVYQDYFLASESTTASWRGSKFSIHMQFGWLLFLVLRMRVLPQFADLVTCTNGLLAVITIMILHMPPHLTKPSCEDTSNFAVRTAGGVNFIASLCDLYDASEKDVLEMVEHAGAMVQEVFRNSSVSLVSSCGVQVLGVDTKGLPHFGGLMEDLNLITHIQIVESDYERFHRSQGELDERVFLRDDDTLIGAMSLSSLSVSGVKRKFDGMSSPNRATAVSPLGTIGSPGSSPFKGEPAAVATSKMPPPTPVSTTMTTAKWFRTVITPLPSGPSAELQQAFRSCDHDVSQKITSRLQILTGAIFPSSSPGNWHMLGEGKGGALLDSAWAEQRRLEATKLYYKVLGAMCRSEVRRQPGCNLTALLSNEKYHRCMIACSAELVLAAHKTVTITFSAVLESTGISAFDLSKVIEGFVRYEETLPRELKRHLNSLEERLLESMAWEKGSSMYSSLIVAKASLSAEINRLCLLPDPQVPFDLQSSRHTTGMSGSDDAAGGVGMATGSPPRPALPSAGNSFSAIMSSVGELGISCLKSPAKERTSAFSAFASPVKGRVQPSLHSQFASPQKLGSPGGGETCAEIVINVFFQKVLKLSANRVRSLCERLQLSSQIMDHVYSTMRQMLYRGTAVFFNRHIDQLILCSIYGVCKVSRVNVTFRDIIFQYRKQPQCKPHVFRNVFIDRRTEKPGGPDTGDVIRFYNEVFVPSAKAFLMDSTTEKCDRRPSEAAEPPAFPALPNMSPKKVSAAHNVFVSPLRGMKMDFIMSPHTRSLYACVGESTYEYQSPSKDLSAINNRLNSRPNSRRLDFGDVGPVVRERNPPASGGDVEQASHPSAPSQPEL